MIADTPEQLHHKEASELQSHVSHTVVNISAADITCFSVCDASHVGPVNFISANLSVFCS